MFGAAIVLAIGYESGLDKSIAGILRVMTFLRDQAVTIMFLALLGSVLIWIMKLHFSDDPKFVNFDLMKLVTHPDGSPDPKKISLWMATGAGMFAFFYLLMHDRPVFATFSNWFLLTLFGYAGVVEVFGKKEPPLEPGKVVVLETSEKSTTISKVGEVVPKPEEL